MEPVLITVGVTALSAVAAWVTAKSTQRKLNAEGTQILVQTALDLNEPLRARILHLEGLVFEMRAGMAVLSGQLRAANIVPAFDPDKHDGSQQP